MSIFGLSRLRGALRRACEHQSEAQIKVSLAVLHINMIYSFLIKIIPPPILSKNPFYAFYTTSTINCYPKHRVIIIYNTKINRWSQCPDRYS